jgi:ubiquinone/menaquinone biosynthesis C-methylase UbiE
MPEYVLDNAGLESEQRFASLESCWDPVTIAHLERIGVAEGWSCLEVGGGGGSLGAWLGERVGRAGSVLVTDIDPRWMSTAPNVEVRRHDIVTDELDAGCFDLVHARLVLLHLPERRRALAKMVEALKPGGWLLIDDFDCTWLPFVPNCHDDADARLFLKVADAFHQVLKESGADIAHGRGFYPMLLAQGLVNVQVDGTMQIWPGGSPGALLWQANIEQLRDTLASHDLLSEEEIERFCGLVEDPDFSVNSYLLVSGLGQRPSPHNRAAS